MGKSMFHLSVENAFYFSFAVFVIVWIAGFLYEFLEKTPGRLNLGAVILIVLGLVLAMLLIALASILFGDEAKQSHGFFTRLAAVLLFAFVSVLILAVLAILAWYQF